MSKVARSDEPNVNQVQIISKAQMTQKILTFDHLTLVWHLDFEI